MHVLHCLLSFSSQCSQKHAARGRGSGSNRCTECVDPYADIGSLTSYYCPYRADRRRARRNFPILTKIRGYTCAICFGVLTDITDVSSCTVSSLRTHPYLHHNAYSTCDGSSFTFISSHLALLRTDKKRLPLGTDNKVIAMSVREFVYRRYLVASRLDEPKSSDR
jgi:hypothetical protein